MTLNQNQAYVRVRYGYDPDDREGACQASLMLLLPADEYRRLQEEFQSAKKSLLGSVLESCWGHRPENADHAQRLGIPEKCRYETYSFSADTWDELEQLIRDAIENIRNTLHEVIAENRKNLEAMPPPREIILEF